jgi:hypothetical protein
MGGANVALPFPCKNMGICPILYDILYADFDKKCRFLKNNLEKYCKIK